MTPKTVNALACSVCGHVWPEKHRQRAERCCTCSVCGGAPTLYTGDMSKCRLCDAKETLAVAKVCLTNAEKMVADAERALAKLVQP